MSSSSRAGDSDAKSILDKAITALGGAEKLAKIEAFSMKAKGTVVIDGKESDTTSEVIYKGLDHFRREFGNDQFHGVIVVDGDKGWRKLGDNSSTIEPQRRHQREAQCLPLGHPNHTRAAQGQRLQIRDRGRGEDG